MKELSIEDKSKRYDEAIKRAQAKMEEAKVFDYDDEQTAHIIRLTTTDIFPELKESEDERIRKALIRFHKSTIDVDGIKGEDIIAWLDKQGEQKPVEEINGEDYGIDGLYAAMDILNKTLGQVEGYQSDDGILEHKAAMTAVKKLYKQKPVELEKEEKSRLMKKCVHRAYQQGYDTGFHMATTELEHKQEWSEEDESMRIKCIGIFETYCAEDASRLITWLKSLKDRVQPQNKWKESLATADLENSLCDIQDGFSDTSYEYRILGEAIEFIRCTEPKPQWKPSEEQIRELSIVATGKGWFSTEILSELLEQLKKLRED